MNLSVPVTLEDVLASRDRRASRQRQLLDCYGLPLVSFCLNVPGIRKYTTELCRVHADGCKALWQANLNILHAEVGHYSTGIEGLFVVNTPARTVKDICCAIEETHPLGRLFDFDVLGADGTRWKRQHCGYRARTCWVCGGEVWLCRRSEAHSLEDMWACVRAMMDNAWFGDNR